MCPTNHCTLCSISVHLLFMFTYLHVHICSHITSIGPSSPLAVLGGATCLLPMGHLVRIQYKPLTPATHPHMVLASSGDMPLEALATIADKVMEVASTSISYVSVAPLTLEVGQLRSDVAQLREMIAVLKIAPSNPHRRARSRSQSTSAAPPPFQQSCSTPRGEPPICQPLLVSSQVW